MNKIYIKTWLALKPTRTTPTDSYYLKLSNTIKEGIGEENILALSYHLESEDIDVFCCFLASYLEDVVSEIGIWRTFVSEHEKLYGKKLPFFNTEIYYEDEINKQDLLVLIWYFLNSYQKEALLSPYNPIILSISNIVMEILDDAYEYAPENKVLKDIYTIHEKEDNFYRIRNLCGTLLFNTWLFYPDTAIVNDSLAQEIIEKAEEENILEYLSQNHDTNTHNFYTALLSFRANEWTAKRLGKTHPLYNDILNMSQKINGYFLYKEQDEKFIYFEHIASGKKFNLFKGYFDDHVFYTKPNTIAYIGIVRWKNAWAFSGITTSIGINPSFIKKQKQDLTAYNEVIFLDYNSKEYKKILKEQYYMFLKYNNGSPIAFLSVSQIENFNKDFLKFFNSKKIKPKKLFKEIQDGLEINKNVDIFSNEEEGAIVFFNKKSGIEVVFGANSAFPTKRNSFFEKEKSNEHVVYLLYSHAVSKELVWYCIENYKDKLSYFKTKMGEKYFNDLDFLLRIYKKEGYHSIPKMVLI